jgi:hypothetical protein
MLRYILLCSSIERDALSSLARVDGDTDVNDKGMRMKFNI